MTKEEKQKKAEEKKRLKEEKKALAEAKRLEKKKNPRIRSGSIKYVFRIVFILVMLAFVGLGVYYVMNFENTNSVKRNMKAYRMELQNEAVEKTEVEAFATAFVATYYYYNPEDDTGRRELELQKYIADDVDIDTPFSEASSVVSANVMRSFRKDNGYEVHVRVNVIQKVPKEEGSEELIDVDCNYVVTIPIVIEGGNMAVQGIPTYIGDKNVAKGLTTLNMTGQEVSDGENKEITELASNFLKAYCGSKKDDLTYFVTDSFDEEILNNAVEFKDIDNIVATNNNGEYKAAVRYSVISPAGEETQELVLNLVKTDKFYVDSINVIWW